MNAKVRSEKIADSNHYINKCKEACTKHLRNMLKGIKICLGEEVETTR